MNTPTPITDAVREALRGADTPSTFDAAAEETINNQGDQFGIAITLRKKHEALLATSVSPAAAELVALNLDYALMQKKYTQNISALAAILVSRDEEIAALNAAHLLFHNNIDALAIDTLAVLGSYDEGRATLQARLDARNEEIAVLMAELILSNKRAANRDEEIAKLTARLKFHWGETS